MVGTSSPSELLEVSPNATRRMRYLMGCFVEIEVTDQPSDVGISAIEAAFSEMRRIESILSCFVPESTVSVINKLGDKMKLKVLPEVFDLIDKCNYFSKITEGAFDLTTKPLAALWKNASKKQKLPSPKEIRDVIKHVGYQHIVLNRKKRTVHFDLPNMELDFGAVGKGYAVDKAVQILQSRGIKNGIVNAGSTIYSMSGESMRFGVRDPLNPRRVATAVTLENNAVSTSAIYEQYFAIRNKKYGHLIHPQTGCPVKSNLLSVSVIGSSAMECDILSTAMFIMGRERGTKLIQKFNDFGGIVIASKRFNPSFQISYISNKKLTVK